jgi:hypothetical protein
LLSIERQWKKLIKEMNSKTFRLFSYSGLILLGTFLVATFWDTLGLGENKVPLAVATTIAFGISIAGLVVGFAEIKRLKTLKVWVGFVGHFIIIAVFVLTVIYAMTL